MKLGDAIKLGIGLKIGYSIGKFVLNLADSVTTHAAISAGKRYVERTEDDTDGWTVKCKEKIKKIVSELDDGNEERKVVKDVVVKGFTG